MEEIADQ